MYEFGELLHGSVDDRNQPFTPTAGAAWGELLHEDSPTDISGFGAEGWYQQEASIIDHDTPSFAPKPYAFGEPLVKDAHADGGWIDPDWPGSQPNVQDGAWIDTGWYDAAVPPAGDVPYRHVPERGRIRWGRVGTAIGAVALAAAVVATGIFGSRGHTEAHPGPQPAAAAKAHPKWWRAIRQGNSINLEHARWDADHDMTAAVMDAKNSTEEILNYTDVNEKGHALVSACTAFMGENADGQPAFRSAAHCDAGSKKYAAFPNYVVEENIGGKDRQVFVRSFKAPLSYNRFTDAYIDSSSDDMTIVQPYTEDWAEPNGTVHKTPNGITSIHPLKNSLGKAAVGTLLFSWGMKPENGKVRVPPSSPVMQAYVVAGYTDDGNREILIPLGQWNPKAEEGNSGSAVIDDEADVDSTLIIAGSGDAQFIKDHTGLRIIGGKNAPVNQKKITYVVAQTNNQNNLSQVDDAPDTKPAFPSIVPRIKVAA